MATKAQLWLKQLTKHYQSQVSVLLLIRAFMFISQALCFWYFAHIMSTFIVLRNNSIDEHVPWFIASSIAWVVSRYLAQLLSQKLQVKVEARLHNQVSMTLDTQQNALCRQHSSYYWQHIWVTHIPAVSQFVIQYHVQKLLSALIPIFVIVAIIPVNYFVALIMLLTLPIVPVFMILVGKGAARLQQQHFVALERLGGLFVDRLKGLTLLTSFRQHKTQSQQLDRANQLVNDRTMRVVSVAFLSTSVLDFFSTVAMALIAVFIGFSILGEINLGPELPFVYGLYLLLVAPLLFSELKNLGRFYHQKAMAESAADILRLFTSGFGNTDDLSSEEKPECVSAQAFSQQVDAPDMVSNTSSSQNKCRVANANELLIDWSQFELKLPSIQARNLKVKPGEHILLQGASGAGKTVFLEALLGMRVASKKIHQPAVLLNQTAVVIPSSVRENLTLDRAIPDDELFQVLCEVELNSWLDSLPQGLDTNMGEHPPLSGGEAQRLALARVLLHPSDVVLLDEPTAHLTQSQHQILSALINKVCKSKTVIWASHKTLPQDWFSQVWQIEAGLIETKAGEVSSVAELEPASWSESCK